MQSKPVPYYPAITSRGYLCETVQIWLLVVQLEYLLIPEVLNELHL